MKHAIWRSSAALLFAAVCSLALAQAPVRLPNGVTRGPTVEGITEYRLANGLRVVLFADPSKPTATVNITYLVGSRHENYGETGMAHLLEHLIFKGSKNFLKPDTEFTRRGFQNNGTTWLDRTNYYSTFQATDDNLKWAIDWSADAMVNSFIAKKDLDSEMTVVRNEFESGENDPTRVMLTRMQSMLYDWHNYGNSTIGARSDIENVRIENLQAFYRMYYQPDNAVLIVAGKFDEAKTLGWIAQAFGKIPKPKRSLPVFWTVEPTHDGERTFTVRRPGEVQFVMVGYRVPSSLNPQSLPIGIAADVLGDTPNGRLHQALVATGKAAQVFNFSIDAREPGFVLFGAVVKKGEPLEPVRQTMIDVIEGSWSKTPAAEAELKRQVQKQRTAFDRALADPQAFGVGLSEYISLGDWRLFFLQRDQLAKLTASEVDAAARKYFVRDNRVVGSYIPEDAPLRAEIPAAPTSAQLLADYKPSEKGAVSEAFVPSQENIDKRTRVLSFGDLNVALLPKQNRGSTVNVQTQFQWGSAESLTGRMIEGGHGRGDAWPWNRQDDAAADRRRNDASANDGRPDRVSNNARESARRASIAGARDARCKFSGRRIRAAAAPGGDIAAGAARQPGRDLARRARDAFQYVPARRPAPLHSAARPNRRGQQDAARRCAQVSHRLLRNGTRRNRSRRRFRCQADRSPGQRAVHRLPIEGAVRPSRSRVSRGQACAAGDRHARKRKRVHPRPHRLSTA